MWYAVDCYNHFDRLGFAATKEIGESASEFNQENPLLLRNKKGEFDQFELAHLGKRSGPYCVAAMSAVLVWTQRHLADNPLPDSALLAAANDGLIIWWMQNPDKALKWQKGHDNVKNH